VCVRERERERKREREGEQWHDRERAIKIHPLVPRQRAPTGFRKRESLLGRCRVKLNYGEIAARICALRARASTQKAKENEDA